MTSTRKLRLAGALGGNLSNAPAKGILLNAVVDSFEPVRLVFVWSQLDTVPMILGQVNFFQKFRVEGIDEPAQAEQCVPQQMHVL